MATRDVLEVRKNSHVVLDCTVNTSITDLKFSWTRDGQTLPPRKRVYTATNGSLIIEKFLSKKKRNDSGFYECLVSGENGTIIGAQVNVYISSKSFLPNPTKKKTQSTYVLQVIQVVTSWFGRSIVGLYNSQFRSDYFAFIPWTH